MTRISCFVALLWIVMYLRDSEAVGTAVLSPSEEAAWWAGISTQQQQQLVKLFHAPWFDSLGTNEKVAYAYVAQSIYDFLDSGTDSHPDDSYVGFAPLLLRTSFHSSGTFHSGSGTGGSNGGTIFNNVELEDDENACIEMGTSQLNSLLSGSTYVSLADAVVIAGVVALDVMKFPRMDLVQVQGGRLDVEKMAYRERLASPDNDPMSHFVTNYDMTTSEVTALIGGAHNFGAAHGMCSGYVGQWTSDPLSWSSAATGEPEFYVDLLKEDWRWYEVCTYRNKTSSYTSIEDPFKDGRPDPEDDIIPELTCAIENSEDPWVCEEQAMRGCEFADGLYDVSASPCDINLLQLRLRSDFFLKENPAVRPHVETFAADADLLAKQFGVAYRKLTHNGLDRCGLSGGGCGANTKCVDSIDDVTGLYLSSSCARDPQSDYGSWSFGHGGSIAVLVSLLITSGLLVFLTVKRLPRGTSAPELGGAECPEEARESTERIT